MKNRKSTFQRNALSHEEMFSRRAFVVGGLQAMGLCVLGGRLAWLQIAQGDRYRTLSDKNRINVRMLTPSRGEIVDRHGVPLAVNKTGYHAFMVPERAESLRLSLQRLKQAIELDDDVIDDVMDRARKTPSFVPVEVVSDLSWRDVARIEVHLPDLPGVSISEQDSRSYPLGAATAHVIGYVGQPSEKDVENDTLARLPGFKVGKVGIEKVLHDRLKGQAGKVDVEVNVTGREVRELKKDPAKAGERVRLTLDGGFQRFVQERLASEKSASAAVIDIKNGDIYGLASHPSYDPNRFAQGLSKAYWTDLVNNPGHPLINKSVAGVYPPASTFKMITGLAALEAGIVNQRSVFYCPGHFDYGGDRFHCWKHSGHGWVNLEEALAKSCDVYFYEIATKIGIDQIADMARRFGLGQDPGVILDEAKKGLVPDRNWKLGQNGQSWKPGETIITSIGQGSLQSTPLQLAVMVARLVSDGKAVRPYLLHEEQMIRDTWSSLEVNSEHLALIRRGMEKVVNDRIGTAHASRISEPGMEMGGKTGTAQVKRITMEQREEGIKNEELEWKLRHHALFVGYAPLQNPRYACSVVVDHGGGGSSAAAPIAKDILLEAQRRGLGNARKVF